MNLAVFFTILAIEYLLIAVQFFSAYDDAWLTPKDVRWHNEKGWALIQHAGVWGNIIVISPMTAWIVAEYSLPYISWHGFNFLLAAVAITLLAAWRYRKMGEDQPEAFTYSGKTTLAGKYHWVFTGANLWILSMFLLAPVSPTPSPDILNDVALVLSLFFVAGIIKISPRWMLTREATIQAALLIIAAWGIVILREHHVLPLR